jgi:AraC-like DNA-binding protein
MPERLWREAVLLARELGPERVASALGLSRSALARRMSDLTPVARPARTPAFVDVTAALAPSPPLALEIVARDGTRLRFQGPLCEVRSLVLSVVREES